MKRDDEYTCDELTNISHALIDFVRTTDNLDVVITAAASSGVESGRLLGLTEAHDFLLRGGFTKAAAALKDLLDEEYPPRPIAKA